VCILKNILLTPPLTLNQCHFEGKKYEKEEENKEENMKEKRRKDYK
jgi:hypothetical protein